ncbi:fimbrial protein [Citrobacter amalonaticus]|uniref:fimbrial protein n=1 Tax=Citrobacter amalonaticus TaxID=35703 RepID=UPI00300C855F
MKPHKDQTISLLSWVMKLPMALFIFAMSGNFAWAYTNWCTPPSGTPYQFNSTFNYTDADPSTNKAGQVFDSVTGWDLGTTYSMKCDCDSNSSISRKFKATTDLSLLTTVAGKNYYKMGSVDEVGVHVAIFIGGQNKYFDVPFENIDNLSPDKVCNTVISTANSGSKGKISLYIAKPFVGKIDFPQTLVASLFATKTVNSYSSTPISQVYLSGSMTVPQSCEINDGQVINIDYDTIINSALKTKGAVPDGFTKKVTDLAYICTNITDGVKISFTFKGTASSSDPDSISTDKSDIGIHIEDMNGVIITPNSGKLASSFDYQSQTGTTSFQSYPVNTTGNAPELGVFTAAATITTNIE